MQEALAARTGKDLKDLRNTYGITQDAVAAELRVHVQTVIRWERPATDASPVRWARYRRACEAVFAREAGLEVAS